MVRVGAADLQRQFGSYTEAAQREPITITKHGRDSLVLMSIESYDRLKALDTRQSYSVFDLPSDIAEAILNVKVASTPARKAAKKSN